MNKKLKFTLYTTLATSLLASTAAVAELSGNVGVASNYVWRGMTQTGDQAAVSGGLDYDFGTGLSAGTWVSNVSGGYELDLYAGYGGSAGAVDYSVGFIHYAYPVNDGIDFTELTAGIGTGPVSFDVAYTASADNADSEGDLYFALGGSTDIKEGLSLGGTIGMYAYDAEGSDDLMHYQISLSKGDFTFALDGNDGVDDDPRVSVAWSFGLDL